MISNQKPCSRCKMVKPLNEFAWRYKGGTKTLRGTCVLCRNATTKKSLARPEYREHFNERRRTRRLEKSKFLFDILSNSACSCGERDPFVLQFDHVRGEKLFNLSAEIREKSFDEIKEEVKKCDIICGNCHMRKTKKVVEKPYQSRRWMANKRRKINEYFSNNPCVDCGETDIFVLEFDHVRGDKNFTISQKIGNLAWAIIENEIAKCDIRCTNCHLKRTIATSDNHNWYKVMMWKELKNE